METQKQIIIEKVIKLLDLAEGTQYTNESNVARDKAAALMAKYDIAEIESGSKPQFETSEQILTRLKPIKYDSVLIQIVSSFNGVAYIKRTGGRNRGINVFVGTSVDIECNDFMIDILMNQRLAGWKEYLKDHKAIYGCSPTEADKKAWFMGFAFGVEEKLDALAAMRDNKIQEHGLVPIDKATAAMEEYKKNNDVRHGKGRAIKYSAAGHAAGKAAHIHKGLDSQPKTGLIV